MQYLLNETEYSTLVHAKNEKTKLQTEELQKLCSQIANEMPVTRGYGNDEPKPWGCILTSEHEWYCDKCPVTSICPNPDKEWSK